uniref:Trigger factor ribosome-binding bacterial domain-containing protein n=1 Tax=Quercus lobata TaxID=97700 RepID=A0A7N2MSG4_QUELO
MEIGIAVNSLFLALNPKITVSHKHKHKHKQAVLNGFTPGSLRFSPHFRYDAPHQMKRRIHKYHPAVCAVISGVKDVGVSSSQFDDFSVAATSTSKGRELKISVEIFGAKTQAIFDNVFDKMVAAAQPIPGFRRVKGGKIFNLMYILSWRSLGYVWMSHCGILDTHHQPQPQPATHDACLMHLTDKGLEKGWLGKISGISSFIPKDILLEVLGPSKVYEQVIKEVINSTIAEYVEKEGLKVSKDLRVEQSFEDLEATFEAGQKFSFDVVIQLQEMN